jgi:hypothetical protein
MILVEDLLEVSVSQFNLLCQNFAELLPLRVAEFLHGVVI